MESIEIDDEVFAHLQKNARPFVDTPNSTLRRLLDIDHRIITANKKSASAELEELKEPAAQKSNGVGTRFSSQWPFDELKTAKLTSRTRSKAPKADLAVLIKENLLRNGQKLFLVDYQGNKVQKFSANISGNNLAFNGQRYSMSNLAQELLLQLGFKSNSVRGPAHWITDEGNSIKDIWQKYLDR
jgi:hypothetical protein